LGLLLTEHHQYTRKCPEVVEGTRQDINPSQIIDGNNKSDYIEGRDDISKYLGIHISIELET